MKNITGTAIAKRINGNCPRCLNKKLPVFSKECLKAHIGIIASGSGSHAREQWVVHNTSNTIDGPVWNDELFDYTIIGHLRFQGEPK